MTHPFKLRKFLDKIFSKIISYIFFRSIFERNRRNKSSVVGGLLYSVDRPVCSGKPGKTSTRGWTT